MRWLSTLRVALLLPAFAALNAQAVTGVGDDAIPHAKRGVRYGVSGVWSQYGTVYAPDANGRTDRRPLLSALSTNSFGVRAMPQLNNVQQAIRALSGRTDFSLSLGSLEANGIVRQTTVPFTVDVGITSRIGIAIVVPYVESKQSTQLILNRDGTGANVGQNPTYATTGAAVRASNAQLLRQIAAARAQLSAEVARCAAAGASGCDAIKSGSAAAQELLQRALSTQSALASVYGDSVRGGSPVVPITGSTTQLAINASLVALRNAFEGFGVTSIAASSLPAAATLVAGPGSLARIANDTAFGLAYTDLGGKRRAGIGDVDLTASVLLWDTFNADQAQRLLNRGRAVRSMLSAGWRFGSAGADRVDDAFDVPIGDGVSALLLRSTTDLVLNHRFWVSASARLARPIADRIATAAPIQTDSTTFAAFQVTTARRLLGQRTELELAPRVVLGEFFGVSGAYLFRRVAADVLTMDVTSPIASASSVAPAFTVQSNASRTFQALAFGLTFSSVSSYSRGRSRYPVEVRFVHVEPMSASGGITPAISTDRLEFRLYTGFPRR